MNALLEILFTILVLADTWLTYAILESGKGREKLYWQINWPVKFKLPTLMGFPASGVFALVCWRNWKIWRA
jgi:hypothetical protein